MYSVVISSVRKAKPDYAKIVSLLHETPHDQDMGSGVIASLIRNLSTIW